MKLTSRQKSLLNRIATATRVNYGDSPRTAGSLIRLGLVAKASGEALRLTPQGKAEFYAPTMPKLHYFQSEVEPKVGDEISIGKNGRCRVEAIGGGELQARNIHTGELFTVFADDCDLLGRADDAEKPSATMDLTEAQCIAILCDNGNRPDDITDPRRDLADAINEGCIADEDVKKASATMNLTDLSYVRSVLAGRVASSVADGYLEAPAGAKCRTRSGFRAWLRRAEKQLKAEVENSGGDLETKASATITKLHAAKLNREANSLGRIVGAWRKGHVGDCALRNAITGSERRLAQTGTPTVEHVTQDAATGEAANKRDGNPEGNEDYHLAGGGEKIVCTTDEREAYEDATGVEIESDVLARDIFFEFLTWLQSNFEMEQAADKMPSPEPYVN